MGVFDGASKIGLAVDQPENRCGPHKFQIVNNIVWHTDAGDFNRVTVAKAMIRITTVPVKLNLTVIEETAVHNMDVIGRSAGQFHRHRREPLLFLKESAVARIDHTISRCKIVAFDRYHLRRHVLGNELLRCRSAVSNGIIFVEIMIIECDLI